MKLHPPWDMESELVYVPVSRAVTQICNQKKLVSLQGENCPLWADSRRARKEGTSEESLICATPCPAEGERCQRLTTECPCADAMVRKVTTVSANEKDKNYSIQYWARGNVLFRWIQSSTEQGQWLWMTEKRSFILKMMLQITQQRKLMNRLENKSS